MNTFVKATAASAAALMFSATFANAAMILRQDSMGNKVVVNTETETEQRLYGPSADNTRPADCETGAFYTMMDGEREYYVSCDEETAMFSSSEAASPGATPADRPLEPYAPSTIGNTN